MPDDLVTRLRENIVADAFERGAITDGRLAERLIRERLDSADRIEALEAENAELREVVRKLNSVRPNNWRVDGEWTRT